MLSWRFLFRVTFLGTTIAEYLVLLTCVPTLWFLAYTAHAPWRAWTLIIISFVGPATLLIGNYWRDRRRERLLAEAADDVWIQLDDTFTRERDRRRRAASSQSMNASAQFQEADQVHHRSTRPARRRAVGTGQAPDGNAPGLPG